MSDQNKKSKAIKRAILAEIHEDNLRLSDPRHPSIKAQPQTKPNAGKPSRFTNRSFRLALILATGLSLFFLSDWLESSRMTSELDADRSTPRQMTQVPSPSSLSSLPTDMALENEALSVDRPVSSTPVMTSLIDSHHYETSDLGTDPNVVYPVEADAYDMLINNKDIRLATLFGLGVRSIVIDPGHGGKDPGAIGGQGTMEKEITLDVAHRLKKRLAAKTAFNVYLTREADETVSLADRVKFANAVSTDLFVSIHVNYIPEATINTIETYYFGPSSDETTLRLAESENADSKYSSADFKMLIQKIGNTLKQQESIALATQIQRSLFANIRKYDRDVHNWGVKVAPFMVLLDVDAPAVLSEISCISEPEEEKKLNTADYREKIASFVEKGIIAYLTSEQAKTQRGDNDGFKKDG